MKKISEVIAEAKNGMDLQPNTINYIPKDKLQKYVSIAEKFLCEEAKYVIGYLVEHNDTYVKDFTAKKDSSGNALADFYNAGVPKDAALKPLYKNIGLLIRKGLTLQVPVFQVKAQFDGILSKKFSPDEIFLDLTTEKGRNKVAKDYNALVWKVARSFNGKSTFSLDELYSIGLEGLTNAMNMYGKSTKETQAKKTAGKSEDELDKMIDQEKEKARKQYTFLSYAGYMIRIYILEAIKNESHLVRIPISQQNKERKETGKNTKSMSVSGDAAIGTDKDGHAKTLFDTIGDSEDGSRTTDDEDIAKLWKMVYKKLQDLLPERTINIFFDFYGVNGHKKMSGKEVMAKYGMKNPSEISNNNHKVQTEIQNNKALRDAFVELYTLYKECLNDRDRDDNDFNPVRLNEKMNAFVTEELEGSNRGEKDIVEE